MHPSRTRPHPTHPRRSDTGFTLVELLIVIVILGVLATVTVLATRGVVNKGEDATCGSQQRTLAVALEAYHAEAGRFGTAAELVAAERLVAEPELFSVTVSADGQGYRLDGQQECAGRALTTGTPP